MRVLHHTISALTLVFLCGCGGENGDQYKRGLPSWKEVREITGGEIDIASLDDLFRGREEILVTLNSISGIEAAVHSANLEFTAIQSDELRTDFETLLPRFNSYWAPYSCAFHPDLVVRVLGDGPPVDVTFCLSCCQVSFDQSEGGDRSQFSPSISYELENAARKLWEELNEIPR